MDDETANHLMSGGGGGSGDDVRNLSPNLDQDIIGAVGEPEGPIPNPQDEGFAELSRDSDGQMPFNKEESSGEEDPPSFFYCT